jgi:S1-C subfamily serine protease
MCANRCGLIFTFLLGALPCYSAAQQTVAEVVKRSSDAVVLIVTSDSNGQETALGSGFLISADGEVVTNFHVIKDAHSAIVKLSTRAFFPVSGILASDPSRDLAILEIKGNNLPFLALGSDNKPQVGDHVVAIGSPLGYQGTVSDGVISSLRDDGGKKWIQTTAPVSHGNSGGPLLDMDGQVIGIIDWGIRPELGQNLNFAIPLSELTALILTSRQQLQSMDSATETSVGSFTEGTLWTSLTSGADFKVRQDGDFLYAEMILSAEYLKAGAFNRAEVKRGPDGKWRGKDRINWPCEYRHGFNGVLQPRDTDTHMCSITEDIEIDSLSATRIEGILTTSEKFNCGRCEGTGKPIQSPFTWIPK